MDAGSDDGSGPVHENAGRIGKAVEHLVAASCILVTDTALNVSTAFVDDEGVDLVFHRRGGTATLAVQVKSRSTDTSVVQQGKFIANVRPETFEARLGLWMLFVVVDRPTAALSFAAASTTLFTLVAPRMPALPWSPRTGWNRQKRLASSAA